MLPDLLNDWRCRGVMELLYSHLWLLVVTYDGDDVLYGVTPAVEAPFAPEFVATSALGLPFILTAIGFTSSYARGLPRDIVPPEAARNDEEDDKECCCRDVTLP